MLAAHGFYTSLLASSGLQPPYYDWNPTEGSGTTITDKQGSGVDLTTNGTWIGSPTQGVRRDHLGIFNFQYARVLNDALTMAQSSCFLYVKMPPIWSTGQYLCAVLPKTNGVKPDRCLRVIITDGKIYVTIVEASGFAQRTVSSTSTFGVNNEFAAGWTHDGSTLRLYVNGAEEANIACAAAGVGATGTRAFQITGGSPPFADEEPPDNGGVFGSTGAIYGRCVAANRAFTAPEMASLYAQYKAQYSGLP